MQMEFWVACVACSSTEITTIRDLQANIPIGGLDRVGFTGVFSLMSFVARSEEP